MGGYDIHPHNLIEIISYCYEDQLAHRDEMGNKTLLQPGDLYYSNSLFGLTHSERNERPKVLSGS